MSNSTLAAVTIISPNKSVPRNHAIDTVTVHCMAGNLTVEACGRVFANKARQASSNYGIGSDGRIALYVEEKDRSWATSSRTNDNRAVTIEVANDGGANTGWHVSDAAFKSLIRLLTDICARNGISQLRWQANKALIGHSELKARKRGWKQRTANIKNSLRTTKGPCSAQSQTGQTTSSMGSLCRRIQKNQAT